MCLATPYTEEDDDVQITQCLSQDKEVPTETACKDSCEKGKFIQIFASRDSRNDILCAMQ